MLRTACDLCCSRKRRCDGVWGSTCSLCRAKGVICVYTKKQKRGPKPK
ncbi:unnamed protein product, partial [Chrysoparadoxa australica]